MAYVCLMDVDYMFLNTLIDQNVDPDIINKCFKPAQDIDIQKCIGSGTYQFIMTQLANNNGVMPGGYPKHQILLDEYLIPVLAQFVYIRVLDADYIKVTNNGLLKKKPNATETIEVDSLNRLKNLAESDAGFYLERMKAYILNNIVDFPEYATWTGIGQVNPGATYDQQIYTGPTYYSDCLDTNRFNGYGRFYY